MDGNVFRTIEERLPSFSKGKQQIALYILQNPNEATFQTAAQIGKAVNISESSVVRFASDLGYKGFPAFQKALQKEVKSLLQMPIATDASQENFGLSTALPGKQGKLYDLYPCENASAIQDCAEALAQCQRLFLLSTPIGSLLNAYCKFVGELLIDGISALSLESEEHLFEAISSLAPGDAVLALALGQASPLYLFALEQCNKRGACVLTVTDFPQKETPAFGRIVLRVPSTNYENVPYLTPSMELLYDLFSLLRDKKSGHFHDRKKILKEIWDSYDKFQT